MQKQQNTTGQQRTTTYRKPASDEARERANAYRRRYRKEHPDATRRWRENYILRAAARLAAASADEKNGDDDV